MKERPVLFNAEMVNAILSGRKTQTRRPVKFPFIDRNFGCELSGNEIAGEIAAENYRNSPLGKPGDRLWVRETFADVNTENGPAFTYRADNRLKFCLDDESPVNYDRYPGKTFAMWCGDLWRGEPGHIWTPSLHMQRWACRLVLEITSVRAERLNDISEVDALAEGVIPEPCDHVRYSCDEIGCCGDTAKGEFSHLWKSIYGEESWQANPWCWVIEFKKVDA